MKKRAFVGSMFLMLTLSAGLATVSAQEKPIRIVVGYPAGGSTDIIARLLAKGVASHFDGSVMVENRSGASGRIAVEHVKNAPKDGSVLMVAPNPVINMAPSTFKNLTYDPVQDLQPAARLLTFPFLIAVGPAVPDSVKTFPELVQWFKQNPEKANYAHTGDGLGPHFYGLMLAKEIGVELLPVAYKGDTPAVQDVMGGQLSMTINTPAAQLPMLSTGRLRVLATTNDTRIASLPNVPTLLELGYKMKTSDWFGAFLPAGVPANIVQKWEVAIQDAINSPEMQAGMKNLELEPAFMKANEFSTVVKREVNDWRDIVAKSGYVPQ